MTANDYLSIGASMRTFSNVQEKELGSCTIKMTPAESLDKIELLMRRIEEKTQNSLKKISDLTIDNSDALETALKSDGTHPLTSVFNEVEEEVEVFDASSVHEISFKKELKHFFESNSSLGNLQLSGSTASQIKDQVNDHKKENTVFSQSQPSSGRMKNNPDLVLQDDPRLETLMKKKSKILTEGLL